MLSAFLHRVLVATTLASLTTQPALGQDSACTYDLCAVRLHSGRVVQGMEGRRVASLGMFSSRIAVFERAPDSVRAHYNAFRSAKHTGTLLEVIALATATTGLFLVADGRSHDAGEVLFYAGVGLSVGGGFAFRNAGNHLSQAIWWYNRGLTRSP